MPRLSDFPIVEPTTNEPFTFAFSTYLPTGTTLASAVVSLAVYATIPGFTADSTPSSKLSGTASVASGVATQRIVGLVDGNDYLVTCTGTISDGSVIVLWAVIPCRAPGDT